jgi:hypothetical protein
LDFLLFILLFLKALFASQLFLFFLCKHEWNGHFLSGSYNLIDIRDRVLDVVSNTVHEDILLHYFDWVESLLSLRQEERVPPIKLGDFSRSLKRLVNSNTRFSELVFGWSIRQSYLLFSTHE